MQLQSLTPNIMVADVNATVNYYKTKLGFETVMVVDEKKGDGTSGVPFVWAMLKKDNVEIMLQREDSLIEELPEFKGLEIGGTFTLYIRMQDVKSFYNKIKNKVKIKKDIHKTFYGADEFVIKDINGYFIYFAEAQNG